MQNWLHLLYKSPFSELIFHRTLLKEKKVNGILVLIVILCSTKEKILLCFVFVILE